PRTRSRGARTNIPTDQDQVDSVAMPDDPVWRYIKPPGRSFVGRKANRADESMGGGEFRADPADPARRDPARRDPARRDPARRDPAPRRGWVVRRRRAPAPRRGWVVRRRRFAPARRDPAARGRLAGRWP